MQTLVITAEEKSILSCVTVIGEPWARMRKSCCINLRGPWNWPQSPRASFFAEYLVTRCDRIWWYDMLHWTRARVPGRRLRIRHSVVYRLIVSRHIPRLAWVRPESAISDFDTLETDSGKSHAIKGSMHAACKALKCDLDFSAACRFRLPPTHTSALINFDSPPLSGRDRQSEEVGGRRQLHEPLALRVQRVEDGRRRCRVGKMETCKPIQAICNKSRSKTTS